MPNRTTSHEQNKLDHSTHPTTRRTKDDMRAPGGGAAERPSDAEPRGTAGKPRGGKSAKR